MLPTWRGQTEQGMALAAVGYAKAMDRRQVMAATSSVGPGALNMVTAAGLAHANRLPVLLLPGDTFTGRAPDPVLQQVEHFGDPTTTVNDAFRRCRATSTAITRPEQLLSTLPQVARVLTDPADAGPVVLAMPQDVQAEEFDFPAAMFADAPAPGAAAAPGRQLARRGGGPAAGRRAGRCSSSAAASGTRAPGTPSSPSPRPTASRSSRRRPGGRSSPHDHPLLRRPAGHHRVDVGQHPGGRGRRRPGGRHPAAGLHHRVLDGVRRRRCGSSRSTRPGSTRSSTPRTRWSATPERPSRNSRRRWPAGRSTRRGRARAGAERALGTRTSTDCARGSPRTGRSPTPRWSASSTTPADRTTTWWARPAGSRRAARRVAHRRDAPAGGRPARRWTSSTASPAWGTRSPGRGERRWPGPRPTPTGW